MAVICSVMFIVAGVDGVAVHPMIKRGIRVKRKRFLFMKIIFKNLKILNIENFEQVQLVTLETEFMFCLNS